jgi:hypothetical protein
VSQRLVLVSDVIEACERRRCEALVRGDTEALSELLSEALVHVHASGRVERKEAYLAAVRQRFRFVEVVRENYEVMDLGTSAVAWGRLVQRLAVNGQEPTTMRTFTSQVWTYEVASWRLLSFHATREA